MQTIFDASGCGPHYNGTKPIHSKAIRRVLQVIHSYGVYRLTTKHFYISVCVRVCF